MDETLTGTTIPGHNGLGSYGKDGILYILQISRTGASPSDAD